MAYALRSQVGAVDPDIGLTDRQKIQKYDTLLNAAIHPDIIALHNEMKKKLYGDTQFDMTRAAALKLLYDCEKNWDAITASADGLRLMNNHISAVVSAIQSANELAMERSLWYMLWETLKQTAVDVAKLAASLGQIPLTALDDVIDAAKDALDTGKNAVDLLKYAIPIAIGGVVIGVLYLGYKATRFAGENPEKALTAGASAARHLYSPI